MTRSPGRMLTMAVVLALSGPGPRERGLVATSCRLDDRLARFGDHQKDSRGASSPASSVSAGGDPFAHSGQVSRSLS